MGADIHLYVEYDDGESTPFSQLNNINGFSEGDFLIPRHYHLFATLAGVRSLVDSLPLYSPKGMPKIASTATINNFHLNILDTEEERLEEDDVMRSQALEWVKSGKSNLRDSWIKEKGFVSNPEWHTPSWLTLEEIIKSFDISPYKIQDMPKEFLVIIDLLESLEKYFGQSRARIVFWFDN